MIIFFILIYPFLSTKFKSQLYHFDFGLWARPAAMFFDRGSIQFRCQTRTQSMSTSSSSGIGFSHPPPLGPAHGAASTESLM